MTVGTTHLPDAMAVRNLLSGLLFRDVDVAPTEPLSPGPTSPSTFAIYVDDQLHTGAVIAADLALSAHLGAAIGLLPRSGAEAAIQDVVLPQNLIDNVGEVLNVMAALFNAPGHPRLRLYGVHAPDDLAPSDISAIAKSLGRRMDLHVSVAGYGVGALAIILA